MSKKKKKKEKNKKEKTKSYLWFRIIDNGASILCLIRGQLS